AALQLRHRDRGRLRRRRLAVAEQLPRVLAVGIARAGEVLPEAAHPELHVRAAFVAGDDGPVVALELEGPLLDQRPGAVGAVLADVELALLVDQVAVHHGAAERAALLELERRGVGPVALDLGLVVGFRRSDSNRLVAGHQVHRPLAALLGRERVAGAAEEDAGAAGPDRHLAPAGRAGDLGLDRGVALHAL